MSIVRAQYRSLRIKPDYFEFLLESIVDIRYVTGRLRKVTKETYKSAIRNFSKWYVSNYDKFDDTNAAVLEFIRRAKALKDNENNYSVVGNIALMVLEVLEAQDMRERSRDELGV
jgi:hypothetical protein